MFSSCKCVAVIIFFFSLVLGSNSAPRTLLDTTWCKAQRLMAKAVLDEPQRNCNVDDLLADATWTLRRLLGRNGGYADMGMQQVLQCQLGTTDTWTARCVVPSRGEADLLSATLFAKFKQVTDFDYRSGGYQATAVFEATDAPGNNPPMLTLTYGRCPSAQNMCYNW